MNIRWKVFAAAGAGAVLLWFVTFVVEWHIRTDWQQHWLDGAVRAWANFAMLGWVDTTLAAGLFAALAAFTLLLNSSLERERKRADDLHERRAKFYESASALQLSIRRVAALIAENNGEPRLEAAIAQAEHHCAAITHDASPLANAVMFALVGMENSKLSEDEMFSLAWAAVFVLRDPERYFANGHFQVHRLELDEEDCEHLDALRDADRLRYQDWLDWKS